MPAPPFAIDVAVRDADPDEEHRRVIVAAGDRGTGRRSGHPPGPVLAPAAGLDLLVGVGVTLMRRQAGGWRPTETLARPRGDER